MSHICPYCDEQIFEKAVRFGNDRLHTRCYTRLSDEMDAADLTAARSRYCPEDDRAATSVVDIPVATGHLTGCSADDERPG